MTHFLLHLLSPVRPLYEKAGVDFNQLKNIVALKLTMDTRRQSASTMRGLNKKDESSNRFTKSLLILGMFGGFMSIFIGTAASPYMGFTIFFSFAMMMTIMTLISDYSAVLLDTADSVILLPRPVNSATLFWSRITHISLFIGQIIFALSLIPLIVITVKFGFLAAITFAVLMVLVALFALFLTTILYLLAIRYVSEEKLKDFINYLQIGMAVFFYAGYQLLPRLIDFRSMGENTTSPTWWHAFIPPMWMSGAMDSVISSSFESMHLVLIALALIAPLGGVWLMSRYFSGSFGEKLTAMATDYTAKLETDTPSVSEGKIGFMPRLSTYVTSNAVERSAFQLVWLQMSRDRKLKLRLYPQLAYGLVLFVIFLMPYSSRRHGFNISEILENLSTSRTYIMLIYMSSLSLLTMATLIIYSDDFKAAWIYYALPIKRPGEILSGSLKAQVFKFFIPFFMIYASVILFIWGFSVVDDLIFGFLNILLLAMANVFLDKHKLPFSEMAGGNAQGGNSVFMFVVMLIFAAIGGIHYLLTRIPYFVALSIPFQVLVLYFLLKSYKNISWEKVHLAEF
jgi:ABC-2 type transport system permease protein